MRENYVATTLNMYKAIGYEVNFNYEFSNNSFLKEGYIKNNIKRIESYIEMSKSLQREKVLSSNSNFQSEAQYHFENALDFINFYNLLDVSEENIMECDKFDRLGKGRSYVANFSLLNNSNKIYSDSNKFIRHCIYLKTFEILGIDIVSLQGVFRKESIVELQRYYRDGYIDINGVNYSVAKGLKGTLKYTSTNKTYLSKVVSNFLREQFGLKLARKTINVKGVDDNYEYWIERNSADKLLKYSSMNKTKYLTNT